MSWTSVLKNEDEKTTQSKLPKELIPDGATVATRPVEEWFKGKPKKTKPVDNTKGTTQTALDDFEKEDKKPPSNYWGQQVERVVLAEDEDGAKKIIEGLNNNTPDAKGYAYDRVQILRAANRFMKGADDGEKRIINLLLEGIPKALRDTQPIDERPVMEKNIKLLLDGKHDEALEFFNSHERQQYYLKVWDEKNQNKLSEYLKDKPDLAGQLKFKVKRSDEIEKLKIKEENLTPEKLLEYMYMVYKMSGDIKPYLPFKVDGVPTPDAQALFGKRMNPSLEWIIKNPNFNPTNFPIEGTTKTSTQQEAVYQMLRDNIYVSGDEEVEEDIGQSYAEILQNLWNQSEDSVPNFRKLRNDHPKSVFLNAELSQRIKGTEKVNNSLPMKDYELIMSVGKGELNNLDESMQDSKLEPLKKYFGMDIDIYEVEDYYEEHKKALENMTNNRVGGMRATSREDIKSLILLLGTENRRQNISSDIVDTNEDSLDIYLQRIKDYKGGIANSYKISDIKTTQSATLPNVILTLSRIETRFGPSKGDYIQRLIKNYGKNPSEQNEDILRNKISQKTYTEIRELFLDTLRKTIVDYMGAGDKSILHGRNRIEPHQWVIDNIGVVKERVQ
jgi:hypothetical protein